MLDKAGEGKKVPELAEEKGETGRHTKLSVLPICLRVIVDSALCKVTREGREGQPGHQSLVNVN